MLRTETSTATFIYNNSAKANPGEGNQYDQDGLSAMAAAT